jgi:hypothetical protein
MAPADSDLSFRLFRLGASLYLFAFIWGLFIVTTPFRRLALAAHIQAAANGSMIVIAGVLIQNARYSLQQWEAEVVYLGLCAAWPMVLSECAASYWGTKKILPIVS